LTGRGLTESAINKRQSTKKKKTPHNHVYSEAIILPIPCMILLSSVDIIRNN